MTAAGVDRLAVYLNTTLVGHLTDESDQVVGFAYDDAYIDRVDATPLSLSLPLTAELHPSARVTAFLWGLLPDNENTLDRIAIDAGTSARNVFRLLAYVGRDTAGALQILGLDVDPHEPGGIEWIDAEELAVRVAEVRRSAATGLPLKHDNGRWSLAGAQGKIALRYENGRWGIPYGAEPTTHILKPAVTGFAESDVNEAVLLTAARALGLPAARTSVLRLLDETHVLVSQRYDRSREGDTWTRVHQEDLCQALGVAPSQKYQSDGGPGIEAVGSLFPAPADPGSGLRRAIPRRSRLQLRDCFNRWPREELFAPPRCWQRNSRPALRRQQRPPVHPPVRSSLRQRAKAPRRVSHRQDRRVHPSRGSRLGNRREAARPRP